MLDPDKDALLKLDSDTISKIVNEDLGSGPFSPPNESSQFSREEVPIPPPAPKGGKTPENKFGKIMNPESAMSD